MTSSPFNATLFVALSAAASLFPRPRITLDVVDPPGEGFNDPHPSARGRQ